MKTLMKATLISLCLLIGSQANTQNLNYNAPVIRLTPDESFLPDANWQKLFYESSDKIFINGNMKKQIAVAPDESIFICNRLDYSISKLDKKGRIIKTFGKKGYGNGEFVNNPDLWGILNEKFLVVSDAQGRINFFDLNGNFVKLITIDFMPLEIYPVSPGKLIVFGHVPMGTKSKKLLAVLDYNTGKYKQIYYVFEKYDAVENGIQVPVNGGGMIVWSPPFSSGKIFTAVTNDGELIFSKNNEKIVKFFSSDNNNYNESQLVLDFQPLKIDDKAKTEFYENMKNKLIKYEIDTSYAEKVYEEGFFPDHLPYFYNLMVDQQNNLLFFVFTNDNKDYAFRTYTTNGKFLGQSEFKIDGYDLLLKNSPFIFKNNSIYTIALKKGAEYPARIIKCRLTSE